MNPMLVMALLESLTAELTAMATEAGRVLSSANEQTLRNAVQALNAVLAQVQQAPVAPDQPGTPPPNGQPTGQPAVPIRQSVDLPEGATWAQESVVPLSEAALRDGQGLIRIITPGWGSSGYYPQEVLARDAASAWPRGTKMFWDHPEDPAKRPERSLRDLAAELTEDARWMDRGPDGPGVYARAKVFKAYQPVIEELADHIGVSIRSQAHVGVGSAEGRTGPIMQRILPSPLNSVDFVTIPGRGGRVASIFEAARGRNVSDDAGDAGTTTTEAATTMTPDEQKALNDALEAQRKAEQERDTARIAVAVLASRDVVAEALRTIDLPGPAKATIAERLCANPPLKDGVLDRDAMKAAAVEAATKEAAYIAALTGRGEVRGMGAGSATTAGEAAGAGGAGAATDAMTDAFLRLGLSESAAKVAAAGRRN